MYVYFMYEYKEFLNKYGEVDWLLMSRTFLGGGNENVPAVLKLVVVMVE